MNIIREYCYVSKSFPDTGDGGMSSSIIVVLSQVHSTALRCACRCTQNTDGTFDRQLRALPVRSTAATGSSKPRWYFRRCTQQPSGAHAGALKIPMVLSTSSSGALPCAQQQLKTTMVLSQVHSAALRYFRRAALSPPGTFA